MALLRVPVNLTWNGNGTPGRNTFHCRTTDDFAGAVQTPAHTQLQAALDALHTLYTAWAPYFGYAMSATGGNDIVDITDTAEPKPIEATPWTVSQASVGGLPQYCALSVGWTTSHAGPSGRGRTFLGPLYVSADDENLGIPNMTMLTPVRDAAAAFVASSEAANDWAFAVVSREGLPGQQIARDITGTKTNRKFAVLRSRRD